MTLENTLSTKTRWNWIVDMALFVCALLCSISGLYFLFTPHGGYRGGRNEFANTFLALDRQTWKDIHIYSGLLMIAIAIYHIIRHWDWIKCTLRRIWMEFRGASHNLNGNGGLNIVVNTVLVLAFIVSAVSGLYFYLVPHGGGRVPQAEQSVFLFSKAVWNWLHNWIGLTFVIAAVTHLVMHWGWIARVTGKMIGVSAHAKTTYSGVLER